MDGLIITAIILGVAFAAIAGSKRNDDISGMEEDPVSIENIRRGVANGWYTCVLTRVNGSAAVRISGKVVNGKQFTDVYPITEEDWKTLKAEGYDVV